MDVLDLDERHGGAAAFARIKDRLARTRIFRTGGDGGWHIQFVHHPGMRSILQGGLRGLDGAEVKSTGGYAIAWWAMGIVEIIDDTPPAPWPDFLLETGSYRPPPPIEQVAPCPPPEFSREESIALRGFAGVVGRVATAALGNRNAVTFWAACRAGELVTWRILDPDYAANLLADAAASAGLPRREALRTIWSGINKTSAGRRRYGQ